MLFLSAAGYSILARRLSHANPLICALPSGVSLPHLFVVVFVVMKPIFDRTGSYQQAWSAGLAWVTSQSLLLLLGLLLAPLVRLLPRSALLSTLAGVSLTFISMRPALQIFSSPILGLPSFILLSLAIFGRYRLPLPPSILAALYCLLVGWTVYFIGNPILEESVFGELSPRLSLDSFVNASHFAGFHFPTPKFSLLWNGTEYLGEILVTAIPFGIYDFLEIVDNVESAAAAGDVYPIRLVLILDAFVSFVGSLLGSPFMNVVYIGHPGWKQMGGRVGYSAATGLLALLLTWFGLMGLLTALLPSIALAPVLLYIGLLIASQAFQESPPHAPAIVLGLVPHIASWTKSMLDYSPSSPQIHALIILGSGPVLSGMLLSSIMAYIIDGKLYWASLCSLLLAGLTLVGLTHAEEVALLSSIPLAVAYALIALTLAVCGRFLVQAP